MAASKPTSPLSLGADILCPFTVNHYFGTLTVVRVVPLSDTHLTHAPRLPRSTTLKPFGVGQGTDKFPCLNPQSVALQVELSRSRLDLRLLWQEPAITSLDWLFTPNPKSEQHLHIARLLASTRFYPHFTMPWIRSIGFGSHPRDYRHFHTASLIACGLVAFASASS